MGQVWFQNRSIEFDVVRLDRFCCPIALTIAVQNLCAMLLSHLFWPLHAMTNHNLNVSHSTRFLLFLSNSPVSPKFNESMLRVPFTHKAPIRCVMSWFLDDFCHALHFVVTSRAQPFVEPTAHMTIGQKEQEPSRMGYIHLDSD